LEVPCRSSNITLAEGRTPEQKRALLGAVSAAVTESVGAEPGSVRVWLTEFAKQDYIVGQQTMAERDAARQSG